MERYVTRPIKKNEIDVVAQLAAQATRETWLGYRNYSEEELITHNLKVYSNVLRQRKKYFAVTVHQPTSTIVAVSFLIPFSAHLRQNPDSEELRQVTRILRNNDVDPKKSRILGGYEGS